MLNTAFIAFNTYFLIIATTIGVGILSLPTALSHSGLIPFLVSSVVVLLLQCCIVLFMVEMMQKAICLLRKDVRTEVRNEAVRRVSSAQNEEEAMTVGLLQDTDANDDDEDAQESPEQEEHQEGLDENAEQQKDTGSLSDPTTSEAPITSSRRRSRVPRQQEAVPLNDIDAPIKLTGCDLHTMASLFLPAPFQVLFETVLCAHFVFLLAAYALAGSRAYSEFLTDPSWYVFLIFPFVVFFSLVIVFGFSIIQYLISFLTVIKGSLLVLVIVVVGIFSRHIDAAHSNNFQYIARPLLLTTASLGGAFATVSLLFGRMKLTKLNVRVFTMSALAALVTCWLLNVLWAWIVLRTVPQRSDSGPSLEKAYHDGQISTQPVTEIILKRFPQYNFIISAISGFIVLSISVSFITMGAAMLETVRGFAKTELKSVIVFYGLIALSYLIAQSSPSDFEIIMESMTSFCINLASGVFVGLMLISSQRFKVKVPVSMGPRVILCLLALCIIAVFSLICGFDVVYSVMRRVNKDLHF